MAQTYRLYVKSPPERVSARFDGLPANFKSGEHFVLWLMLDESRWFVPPVGNSQAIARRSFGGIEGEISGGGPNLTLMRSGVRVGEMPVAQLKATAIEGVIGVKFEAVPSGGELFTAGLYFAREPVWADRSTLEKFGEILSRAANNHATGELRQVLQNLLMALPAVFAVIGCFIALGELAPGAIVVVAGLVFGLAAIVPRSAEYVACLAKVDEIMKATDPDDRDIEAAAQALALFFGMVLEDIVLAAAAAKATPKMQRSGSTKINDIKARYPELFTQKKPAAYEQAASAPRAKVHSPEFEAAADHAFYGVPKFEGKTYGEIVSALERSGFEKKTQGNMDPEGYNRYDGGSEIWVRKTNPELAKKNMVEAVRIDMGGHKPKFFDGPMGTQQHPGTSTTSGRWTVGPMDHASPAHVHKEIVTVTMLEQYLTKQVPASHVAKFSDGTRPVAHNDHLRAHIHAKNPSAPVQKTGKPQPGASIHASPTLDSVPSYPRARHR